MIAQYDASSGSGVVRRGDYAAMWNRIGRLRRDRKRKGSSTVMNWIESHVQDEAKRVGTSSDIEFACYVRAGLLPDASWNVQCQAIGPIGCMRRTSGLTD